MQVIGWALGIAFGAALGAVLVWLVRAPFRAGRYVSRSVRAHDLRNRQALGLIPPGVTRGQTQGFSDADRDLIAGTDAMLRDMKERGEH